jgi:hypothetical protein
MRVFKRGGLLKLIVIPLLFIVLVTSDVAFADYAPTQDYKNACGWRITFGMQWNQQDPALHYELLHDRSNPTLDIDDGGRSEIVSPFSSVSVEGRLSKKSSIDLTYTKDHTSSVLVGQKNVLFLFFLLRNTVKAPVDINVQAVRLRYFHTIGRSGNFEFGGSSGLQALYLNAHALLPVMGYSEENYFYVLPCVGAYASYQPDNFFCYSVRADYLPLELKKISVRIADVDCRMEYKINANLFAGVGCRYSVKSLEIRNKKYLMNSSYDLFGGLVFMGIYF